MNRKRIAILGAGESGIGAAILAKKQGFDVFVSDKGMIAEEYKNVLIQNGLIWEEGMHTMDSILNADEVIKSPGIPDKVEVIQKIIDNKIPVISQMGRETNKHKHI